MSINRRTVQALQPIERDSRQAWRAMEGPVTGFRLKMNLPYIYRVGFTNPAGISEDFIRQMGYSGAIQLKNGAATYLYR